MYYFVYQCTMWRLTECGGAVMYTRVCVCVCVCVYVSASLSVCMVDSHWHSVGVH